MDQPSPGARRKVLVTSVGVLLNEIGFDSCDKMALETLTEMMQAFITEVGELSKNYCELTGRSQPILGDISLALTDLGITTQGIEQFAKRPNRSVLPTPQAWQPQKQLNMLQAGTKLQHPYHVPNYFPDFPHPHAYIRTPTHKQPVTEYEAIREKAATQKRDMERALTRFLARTGPTHNLFESEDASIYPLIAAKRLYPPYISALVPQDQIFDPEELEYDPRDDPANQAEPTPQPAPPPPKSTKSKKRNKSETVPSDVEVDIQDPEPEEEKEEPIPEQISPSNSQKSDSTANPDIDNPYLRATKMPRKKLITKINVANNTCSTIE